MTVDTVTFWVWVGFWPAWIAWELVLLRLRALPGDKPKTISMVARDRGWQLNSVVYAFGGLTTHFWWPSPHWGSVVGGVAFWVALLVLFGVDVALWPFSPERAPRWALWARWPLLWLVVGALAGRFLFPQPGIVPWR